MVHASFYRVGADYYQQSNSFADYYRTTLLYLACVELEELQERERQRLAYDLSIAALVSDSIYNFGELPLNTFSTQHLRLHPANPRHFRHLVNLALQQTQR